MLARNTDVASHHSPEPAVPYMLFPKSWKPWIISPRPLAIKGYSRFVVEYLT